MLAWSRLVDGRGDADEDVVKPAVIVALEAQDEGAPGNGAAKAHGRLHHLRAAEAKATELGGRNMLDQLFGDFDFEFMLTGIELALAHGAALTASRTAGWEWPRIIGPCART